MKKALTYTVREVVPYINWIYYFHAWGMEARFASVTDIHNCPSCRASWISSFHKEEQPKAYEAVKLYQEAVEILRQWSDEPICRAIFLIADAYSEGDDIIVNNTVRIPFLRQQHTGKSGYTLCLSDYIKEASLKPETISKNKSKDTENTIGVFATTALIPTCLSTNISTLQLATLADRLAEATAEKMHEEVRKHFWGYAKEEHLTISELHAEHFQGIRPAVGYPSLPDQSINFLIDQLVSFADIGISISENGAMHPASSVSGFMFAHPQAKYFSIGMISEEQLIDYSKRRGISSDQIKRFLNNNTLHSCW